MEIRVENQEWEFISSHLSKLPSKAAHSQGRPRASDRALFEGILWILVTGSRWRDLPKGTYPAKSSCHRRFAQWSRDGSWLRVQQAILRKLQRLKRIDLAEAFIDGTRIKAKKGALPLGFQEPLLSGVKRAHFS